jgi:hypothetical protein
MDGISGFVQMLRLFPRQNSIKQKAYSWFLYLGRGIITDSQTTSA